ncbi:MAG TPA: hypothetical protein VFL64_07490 [Rhizobacter sp.]|nr:hypothetical protein [Rhizobacter sp.]
MSQIVTATLQRLFARPTARAARIDRRSTVRSRDVRAHRPDFADTRPVVFRSEAFAEDLVATHGAV